jgi:transposase
MTEAIFYLVRSGCAWRMLPRYFPPCPTVFAHFRRWRLDGTLRRMHDRLRALAREAEGAPPRNISRDYRQPDGARNWRRRPSTRLRRLEEQ